MKPFLLVAIAAGVLLIGCMAFSARADNDPMFGLELVGLVAVLAWGMLLVWNLARASALAHALNRESRHAWIAGVACQIIRTGRCEAFAVGGLRPLIFVSETAVETLDREELRAVVLHEEHHRRSFAPLRAAALEAWLSLGGRHSRANRTLTDRLAALETSADQYALDRGVTPSALASALLKIEHARVASSFSGYADRRIGALLESAAGQRHPRGGHLPIEWLPLCLVTAMIVGCRLAGANAPF